MNLSLKINNNNYYYLKEEYLDIISIDDKLNTLENIDNFTQKYSKEDIILSIKRSNIVADETLFENSQLVITYFEKEKIRELRVYTKEDIDYISFDPIDFLFRIIEKKNITNQINNYFISKRHTPEDLKIFVNILKQGSVGQVINYYINLQYKSKRILKDYIFNEILPKMDEKTLKRNNKIN